MKKELKEFAKFLAMWTGGAAIAYILAYYFPSDSRISAAFLGLLSAILFVYTYKD